MSKEKLDKKEIEKYEKLSRAYKSISSDFKAEGNKELADRFKTNARRIDKQLLLSRMSAILAIGLFVASLSFISLNITGNAIGNLNPVSSRIIGIVLFFIGLVCAYVYFKKKKN